MHIRKSISLVLITAMLLIFTFSSANANPRVIHESSTKEIVTSGAILERITRFTDEGWLSINVLRVDLSNPNVMVDSMSSPESIRKLTTTKALAQSKGAVAAINGGFFVWDKTPGYANPVGTVMESGKLLSVDAGFNKDSDKMAVLSITRANEVLYNYWKTSISLIAPDGSKLAVGRVNKPYWGYKDDLSIFTRSWGEKSIGTDTPTGCADIVEILVDDGKITEIRAGQPSAQIPQNGYVIVSRADIGKFLVQSFKPGDEVKLDITTTPDWNKLKTAVTGGAILLKDGKIPSQFTHIPEGTRSTRNPRTAIGSSKDGKQLILVTVDGRQNASIGMTLTELAETMAELGAYNALNLDGGGSATMVARPLGTTDLSTVNSPSDGASRKVANAVGIFSIAPPSALEGLIIDTIDKNVFVNTSRSYTVRGYDKYFNPIAINPDQVKWSVSGVNGSFKGNVFYPSSVGSGKVKATVNGITAEIEVNSLSSPVQLILSQNSVKLPLNKSLNLKVTGKNKNGYYAAINPDDVTWEAKGNIGRFDKSTFIASETGTGYIDASVGNTHAYCAVSVASETIAALDNFEAANGSFTSYPQSVTGSYEISSEQKHSGKSSGKLSYDFTSEIGDTRAAYFVFANGGLPLPDNAAKIGLWVYNTHSSTNWLRGEVYDNRGNKYLIDFVNEMDWTGWKYVEMSLQGISSPAKLARIYLAQIHPVSDAGSIYIDDLTVVSSTYPAIDMTKVPQDTVPVDEANRAVTYAKSADSFRFSVFGQSREPKNLLEKLLEKRLIDKTNKYLEAGVFVGNCNHEPAGKVETPFLATSTGYKAFDLVNSRFIQLDISKKGIRSTDPAQWHWFLEQLNTAKGSNVFIFLADSPKSFSDSLEAKLFQDILTKYKQETRKNVWVFFRSNKNSSYMERGIKYVTSAGYDVDSLTPKDTDNAKYILVTVKGGTVTFEFKPIV